MKRKFVMFVVLAFAVFVSVACSSEPTDQPLPPQNFQAQPNQPAPGAVTNPTGQANPVPGQPGGSGATPRNPGAPQPQVGTQPRNAQATLVPGRTGAFGGPGLAGTVKSVSENSIQLTVQNGNAVTVQVDDKTAYQKNVTGTLADIQPSLRLFVTGETSGSTTKAQTIQIEPGGGPTGGTPPNPGGGQPPAGGTPPAPPGGGQPGQRGAQPGPGGAQPGQGGTVKSVSGNTIQLTGFDGSMITVQVDSKTVIQKSTSAALSDVKAGIQINVFADSSSGANVARVIQIGTNAK